MTNMAHGVSVTPLSVWAGADDLEYLRTGDIGVIQDGNLCITSRRKDLVSCLNPGT